MIKAKVTSLDFVELKVLKIRRLAWLEEKTAANRRNIETSSSSSEEAIKDSGVADESSHLGVLQALANETGVELKILTNDQPNEEWYDYEECWCT